jgi:hypothetical protein
MMCSKLRLSVLAVGLASLGVWAESGFGAPNVFVAHDNNFGSVEPNPNSLAKFNQFVSTLNSYGVDDIEDQSATLTFDATGITASAAGATATFNGGFGIGLSSLVENDSLPPEFGGSTDPVNTVFNFNQAITAFGIFVIQGGDMDSTPPIEPNHNNNPITFLLRDTANNLEQNVVVQVGPDWGFYNVLFVGLQSPEFAFDQVQLLEAGDIGDGMLYDNIVAGNIPEPGSLALVLVGGVCALVRRGGFRRS